MAPDRDRFSDVLQTELAALGSPTAPAGRAARSDAPDNPPCVLVVDDEADMRTFLRSCFEPLWQVEEAANGRAALAGIAENTPALVVADVRMPEMDGVALARALKAEAETRHLPVLLISGQERPTGVGDAFLAKPFTCRRLRTVARGLLAAGTA